MRTQPLVPSRIARSPGSADKLATSESRINPGQQRIDLIPIKRQTFESLAKRFPHDEAMFDHGHDEFSVLVASIG